MNLSNWSGLGHEGEDEDEEEKKEAKLSMVNLDL